ncbi:MAG TPA: hypothetical protein VJ227_03650 [Patescibacteria group bacterium]|nr:hypothetical protein [Patescibacteria group bacterium]
MDSTFKISGCDWMVTLENVEGETAENVTVRRGNDKNFHATMVDDSVVLPEGKVANFRQLLIIEHDTGHDKVGDVVIQFRLNPKTRRYMVQVETENVFLDAKTSETMARAVRSSVDNVAQALKKAVVHSGWIYSNPRRIGGKRIKSHYVIAGWSPQLADHMLDVYEYVQSLDAMGLAAFLKALQHMPENPARAIFKQMRMPASNGNDA